jgi:hypothetical protein
MAQRPPIGSCWRILVQEPHLAAESGNYTALNERATEFEQGGVFDELVMVFDPDPVESGPPFNQQNASCLHLEQMDRRNWYLGIGDLKFNLHVRADNGALEVTLYDGQTTKFSDGRKS